MKGAKQLAEQLEEWSKINDVLCDWRNVKSVTVSVQTERVSHYQVKTKSASARKDYDWDNLSIIVDTDRANDPWEQALAQAKSALERRHAELVVAIIAATGKRPEDL